MLAAIERNSLIGVPHVPYAPPTFADIKPLVPVIAMDMKQLCDASYASRMAENVKSNAPKNQQAIERYFKPL